MNEHEMRAGLRALHVGRTQLPDPPELHQRVLELRFDDIAPQRRWRLRLPLAASLVPRGLTGFATVAVVVALLGALVVVGLISPHVRGPADPALIGDSPSPSSGPSAPPEPEATAVVRPDLVPAAELTVEVVQPGVLRVIGDGARELVDDVWDVAVSDVGETVVTRYRVTEYRPSGAPSKLEDFRVLQLGRPGRYVPDTPHRNPSLRRTADGLVTLFLQGNGPKVLRDGRWADAPGRNRWTTGRTTEQESWSSLWSGDDVAVKGPLTTDRWHTRDEVGLGPREALLDSYATAEGVWFSVVDLTEEQADWLWEGQANAAAEYPGPLSFAGLVEFDGESWQRVDPAGAGIDTVVSDSSGRPSFIVDTAGHVWLTGRATSGARVLARWDGARWSSHIDPDASDWRAGDPLYPKPGGAVWIGDTTVFDGAEFRHLPLPSRATTSEPNILTVDHAPDGNTWMVVIDGRRGGDQKCGNNPPRTPCKPTSDGLYVITPEVWMGDA